MAERRKKKKRTSKGKNSVSFDSSIDLANRKKSKEELDELLSLRRRVSLVSRLASSDGGSLQEAMRRASTGSSLSDAASSANSADYKNRRRSCCHFRLPLLLTLVVASALQVLLGVGVTWVVSNRNVQFSLDVMSDNIMSTLERETTTLIDVLQRDVAKTTELLADELNRGADDDLLPEHLVPVRLYERMRVHLSESEVINLYFSNETGAFYMLGRTGERGGYNWYETPGSGSQNRSQFNVATSGTPLYPLEDVNSWKIYDPRGRPWYSAAALGGRAWSKIYSFVSTGQLGITYAVTLIRDQLEIGLHATSSEQAGGDPSEEGRFNNLRAVVGADVTLADLSALLSRRTLLNSGQAYLVTTDDPGILLAGKAELSIIEADGSVHPVPVRNCSSDLIRLSYDQVLARLPHLFSNSLSPHSSSGSDPHLSSVVPVDDGASSLTFSSRIDGSDYVVRANAVGRVREPYLPWVLVVVVPSVEFFGAIQENDRASVITLVVTMLVAVGVAVLLGLLFTAPLKKLRSALRRMAVLDFSALVLLKSDSSSSSTTFDGKEITTAQREILGAAKSNSRSGSMEEGVVDPSSDLELAASAGSDSMLSEDADDSIIFQSFSSFFSEIRDLKVEFAHLQAALLSFARFIPPEVVQRIVRGDPGADSLYVETRNVTILFSDIADFTSISERLHPLNLMIFLEVYYSTMTEIVENELGSVGEILGDGIFAYWNSPKPVAAHATRAVFAGLLMLEKLEIVNRKCKRLIGSEFQRLDIRIGIHSGDVLSGNIGSTTRMKFGLVGDPVNLASRLEGANKFYGTRLMISEDTFDLMESEHSRPALFESDRSTSGSIRRNSLTLPVHLPSLSDSGERSISSTNSSRSRLSNKSGRVPLAKPVSRKLDVVTVKGKNTPTVLYEVMCLASDEEAKSKRQLSKGYVRALDLFLAKNVKKAKQVVEALLKTFPDDKASLKLLARCRDALKNMKNWSASHRLEEK